MVLNLRRQAFLFRHVRKIMARRTQSKLLKIMLNPVVRYGLKVTEARELAL
jgi:hypothetical protein